MLMTAQYWKNLKSNPAYAGASPDDTDNPAGGPNGPGGGNQMHPSGFLPASQPGDSKFSGPGNNPLTGSGFDIHGRDYWMSHLSAPAQALMAQYLQGQPPSSAHSPSTPNAMQLYPWLFNSGLNFNPHMTMLNRLRPSSGVQFSPIR